MSKRIFLIVLDSFGIGEAPDAADFGDEGSNTLAACRATGKLSLPHLDRLGLFQIDGVDAIGSGRTSQGAFGRMREASRGKDTTVGHWEIAGVVSKQAMPTFPHGFPTEMLDEWSRRCGRPWLCNRPYSGTDVIRDYGQEQMLTGGLIVYTSADSVFQVAAHEGVVPVDELYDCCQKARELLTGELGVGRVIARPFEGEPGHFTRTARRHDFSLPAPCDTVLDALSALPVETIGVGKIYDIFAGRGISCSVKTQGNDDGMAKTLALAQEDFTGLCFVNLVDFDMLYGHRNDAQGYAEALNRFDRWLPELLARLGPQDLVMITADHGCDPSTASTDHSREYTPLLIAGAPVRAGINLGTRPTFADIGATVADYFGSSYRGDGCSLWKQIQKEIC